jgi:hypothetical protein
MAEVLSPGGMMMAGGDGGLGFGSGGGLIGGLILGSLLRQGGNGLFGGGNGGDGAAILRSPPEQASANMALMQSIGQVDKAVAVNSATFEASQATQSLGITSQLASVASSLTNNLNQVNTNVMQGNALINQTVMENRYELSKDVSNDGDKTRALITAQYEATLNRQLSDANAAVIALQARFEGAERSRGIEVTTTNNINQMQQQTQQQQQYGQLYNAIWGLSQSIRSNNEAINVGSGTLTASPTNTNTNIR